MAGKQLTLSDLLKRKNKSKEDTEKIEEHRPICSRSMEEASEDDEAGDVGSVSQKREGRKRERATEGEKEEMRAKRKLYEMKRVREFKESWRKIYPWVEHNKEKNVMFCKFCQKFPRLADQKSNLFNGINTFREETLKYHDRSKCHCKCAGEWEKQFVREPGTAALEITVKKLTEKHNEAKLKRMRILFNTAYFVAKQNLAFCKFESLCELQEKNGLELGDMYKNADKCKEFISCIAKVENDRIKKNIENAKFVTVLADGSTDCAVIEQETVFVRYVNIKGVPCTDFVDIVPLQSANADGVLQGILKALETVGIDLEYLKGKLVGCNFDGASVMMGKVGGVAVKLQQKVEHDLVKIHCVAHNLELGVLDAVKTVPYLKKFQDIVQQIFKFYHYSPKRRREMKSIAAILDEVPIMQTGLQKTRWVASRHRAIDAILKSLPTIVTHFQNSSTGSNEEAAKVKGYLKEICTEKFLRFAHFLCDVMSILADLSKQFQSDTLTINDVGTKLEICLSRLEELKHQKGSCYTTFLQSVHVESDTGTCKFVCGRDSTIEISKSVLNFENEFNSFLDNAIGYCGTRFKSLQEFPMIDFGIFDHRVWPSNRVDLTSYGNDSIERLCNFFSQLLSESEITAAKEEWLELKLRLSKQRSVQPLEVLGSLLQSKHAGLENILLLVVIMLTLSPSTAKCERSFSTMKRIKSTFRSNLGQDSLKDLLQVDSLESKVKDFDCTDAISHWLHSAKTSRHLTTATSIAASEYV